MKPVEMEKDVLDVMGKQVQEEKRSEPEPFVVDVKSDIDKYYLVSRNLRRAPGWGLRRFAEFTFSPRTYCLIFESTLQDLQEEHFKALHEERPWKARWVLVRGYGAFWSAVLAQVPVSFAKRVWDLWKAMHTRGSRCRWQAEAGRFSWPGSSRKS